MEVELGSAVELYVLKKRRSTLAVAAKKPQQMPVNRKRPPGHRQIRLFIQNRHKFRGGRPLIGTPKQ